MENYSALCALSIVLGASFLSSCESNEAPETSDTIPVQSVSGVTSEPASDGEEVVYCRQFSEDSGQWVTTVAVDGVCGTAKGIERIVVIVPAPKVLIWDQDNWDEEKWQ